MTPGGASPDVPMLLAKAKYQPLQICIIGPSGSGKALLLNSMLQGTSKPQLPTEDTQSAPASLIRPSSGPEDGQNRRVAHELVQASLRTFQADDFGREMAYLKGLKTAWKSDECPVVDEFAFLLPQGFSGCPNVRVSFGDVAEVFVTYPSEMAIRANLFELHNVMTGRKRMQPRPLALLREGYQRVIGRLPDMSVRLTSPNQLPIPRELLKKLGKTICYRSCGGDFAYFDRVFVRGVLTEVYSTVGCFTVDVDIRVPCGVLEGGASFHLIDSDSAYQPNLNKGVQLLNAANMVIVSLPPSGMTPDVEVLLAHSTFTKKLVLEPQLHRIVFTRSKLELDLPPLASGSSSSMQVDSSADQGVSTGSQRYKDSVRSRLGTLLEKIVKEATPEQLKAAGAARVLAVKPGLFSSLKLARGKNDEPSRLENLTHIPPLLNVIQVMKLSSCGESLSALNKSWLAKLTENSDLMRAYPPQTAPSRSSPTRPTPKMFRQRSAVGSPMRDIGELGSAEQLTALAVTFRSRIDSWKEELEKSQREMAVMLRHKAKESSQQASSAYPAFQEKYMATSETCRMVLNPKYNGKCLGADMNQLACGGLLSEAPQYWRSVQQRVPEKLEEMKAMKSKLAEAANQVAIRRDVPASEREKCQKIVDYLNGITPDNSLIGHMQLVTKNISSDPNAMVEDACTSALQDQVLRRASTSSDIRTLRDHQKFLLKSLPIVSSRAAQNIEQKYCQLLQTTVDQLERLGSDIESMAVGLGTNSMEVDDDSSHGSASTSPVDSVPILRRVPSATGAKEHRTSDVVSLAQLLKKENWQGKYGHQGSVLINRCQKQIESVGLETVPVRVDSSCLFRALSHQVYGTEEAHSVIRILVLNEILRDSPRYCRSMDTIQLEQYICNMYREDQHGDHLTLLAMATLCAADIILFSPLFPAPVRICAGQDTSDFAIRLAYLNCNEFQSLVLASPPPQSSTDMMDLSSSSDALPSPWPGPAASSAASPVPAFPPRSAALAVPQKKEPQEPTKSPGSVGVISRTEAPQGGKRSAKIRRVVEPTGGAVEVLPLTALCVKRVVEFVSFLPTLGGALPEELVQLIVTELIGQNKLKEEDLQKLLDVSISSLSLAGSKQVKEETCALIGSLCPELRQVSFANCTGVTSGAVTHIARCCPLLESIDLSGCVHIQDAAIHELARGCKRLTDVNLTGCTKISSETMRGFYQQCDNIENLSMASCTQVTDPVFEMLGARLMNLDLSDCNQITDNAVLHIAEKGDRLETLKLSGKGITDKSVQSVAASSPHLIEIDLRGCDQITDMAVHTLAGGCKQLKKLFLANCRSLTARAFAPALLPSKLLVLQQLDLSQCTQVNDEALSFISESCPALHMLSVAGCEAISDLGITKVAEGCRALHNLVLDRCPSVSDKGVEAVARHCKLTKLNLRNCDVTNRTVFVLSRNCQGLISLDLSFCEGIDDAALRQLPVGFPLLRSLFLEEIPNLSATALAALGGCHKLEELKLAYCAGTDDSVLAQLGQGCPMLRSVDLSNCPKITMPAVSDAVLRWPHLHTLALKGMATLTTQSFAHPELRRLVLSWSKNLEDPAINGIAQGCPRLEDIDLAWCSKLTGNAVHKLVKNCPQIATLNLRGCSKVSPLISKVLSRTGRTILL